MLYLLTITLIKRFNTSMMQQAQGNIVSALPQFSDPTPKIALAVLAVQLASSSSQLQHLGKA
ncbi:uncharacterized protein FPRO_12985 [Fusarium proliferatum ET1]|uniref:Uncharacterized protein n=1 Tax=Fusarium proliferatum (strain ET1) TaxID=1227346 RepID=A0A1L7W6Z7_FUSPR|nr:uncharacterized protein FPRO_12985 [Fusarium proliferatum ET1]CZR48375.1 uncharacterized protein FPRO_12985 [Fusarium proliferatum ET1]